MKITKLFSLFVLNAVLLTSQVALGGGGQVTSWSSCLKSAVIEVGNVSVNFFTTLIPRSTPLIVLGSTVAILPMATGDAGFSLQSENPLDGEGGSGSHSHDPRICSCEWVDKFNQCEGQVAAFRQAGQEICSSVEECMEQIGDPNIVEAALKATFPDGNITSSEVDAMVNYLHQELSKGNCTVSNSTCPIFFPPHVSAGSSVSPSLSASSVALVLMFGTAAWQIVDNKEQLVAQVEGAYETLKCALSRVLNVEDSEVQETN